MKHFKNHVLKPLRKSKIGKKYIYIANHFTAVTSQVLKYPSPENRLSKSRIKKFSWHICVKENKYVQFVSDTCFYLKVLISNHY